MGHTVTTLPTSSKSTHRTAAIALIGDGSWGGELGRAAPGASLLALPFDPPCDPEELADKTVVFVDAHCDPALAVAECARLRASGLSRPLLLLSPEPERLGQAAARAGATRVFAIPLLVTEIREFLDGREASESSEDVRTVFDQHRRGLDLGLGVVLDRAARRLSVMGCEQPISVQKFELLCYLADRPGRAIEPRELVRSGVIRPTQVQRLRALIGELRGRLGPAGRLITTVPGFGYRLDLPRGINAAEECGRTSSSSQD